MVVELHPPLPHLPKDSVVEYLEKPGTPRAAARVAMASPAPRRTTTPEDEGGEDGDDDEDEEDEEEGEEESNTTLEATMAAEARPRALRMRGMSDLAGESNTRWNTAMSLATPPAGDHFKRRISRASCRRLAALSAVAGTLGLAAAATADTVSEVVLRSGGAFPITFALGIGPPRSK